MKFELDRGLVKGSIILLISFNIYNLLNFVFHAFMARMLDVSDYSVLTTIAAFITILTIFTESLQTIITKYTSKEKDDARVKNILKRAARKAAFAAAILFLTYIVVSFLIISPVLKIDFSLLSLSGIIIFTSLLMPLTRGIMQGKKKFSALGWNMLFEASIKLFASITLVYLGWRVYGAITGIIIGLCLSFLLSFIPIRTTLLAKEKDTDISGIYGYSIPAFVVMLTIIAFYSIDVIIARAVFSPVIAGYYSVASILSKAIFWGTQPISKAMFPLSSGQEVNKKKSREILYTSYFLLVALIIIAIGIFYVIPGFIIKIFSGRIIEDSITILPLIGVGMGITALTNLILMYKLSIGHIRGYIFLPLVIIIECALFFAFSSSIQMFAIGYIIASAIFLIASFFLPRK